MKDELIRARYTWNTVLDWKEKEKLFKALEEGHQRWSKLGFGGCVRM